MSSAVVSSGDQQVMEGSPGGAGGSPSSLPHRVRSSPGPSSPPAANGARRVLSPPARAASRGASPATRGGLVSPQTRVGFGTTVRVNMASPRSPANQRKPSSRHGRKWATPATPVFQQIDNSMHTEPEESPVRLANPELVSGEVAAAASPVQASSPATAAPVSLFDTSAQETSIVQEASNTSLGGASSEVGGSPSKPAATVPKRRLSAYLQERVDVFEPKSTDPSPHTSPSIRPTRHSNAVAAASPLLSGSITSVPDTSLDLLSPAIAIHQQPQHSLHSLHSSPAAHDSVGEASFRDVGDPDLAAAYFAGGQTSPAQMSNISFGLMPSDTPSVSRGHSDAARLFSPVYSQTSSSGGSGILAALNRPSFLSEDEGDQIRVDLMETTGQEDARLSTLNDHFQSPRPNTATIANASPSRVYTASASTTPAAAVAPLTSSASPARPDGVLRAAPALPVPTSPTPASPSAVFTPTAYFAERSAPLGSISHTKNRPSFNTPEFLTANAVAMDEFFSPVTEAQVLREVTPKASRLNSPTPGTLSFTSEDEAATKRSRTPVSGSRIPVLKGRSPAAIVTGSRSSNASPVPHAHHQHHHHHHDHGQHEHESEYPHSQSPTKSSAWRSRSAVSSPRSGARSRLSALSSPRSGGGRVCVACLHPPAQEERPRRAQSAHPRSLHSSPRHRSASLRPASSGTSPRGSSARSRSADSPGSRTSARQQDQHSQASSAHEMEPEPASPNAAANEEAIAPSPYQAVSSPSSLGRTLSGPSDLILSPLKADSSPPSVGRTLSSSFSSPSSNAVLASYSSPSMLAGDGGRDIAATEGGTGGYRTGLFGASPSPIRYRPSPDRHVASAAISSPPRSPLTPHDIATLAEANKLLSSLAGEDATDVSGVHVGGGSTGLESVTSTATTTVLLSSPALSIIATSPSSGPAASPPRSTRGSSMRTASMSPSPSRLARASPSTRSGARELLPTIVASPPSTRASPGTSPVNGRSFSHATSVTPAAASPSSPTSTSRTVASRSQPTSPVFDRRSLESPTTSPLTARRSLALTSMSTSTYEESSRVRSSAHTSVTSSRRSTSGGGGGGGGVQLLHQLVTASSAASASSGSGPLGSPSRGSLAYPLTIQVSAHLQQLHRFVIFEVEPSVGQATLTAAVDAYVQQLFSHSAGVGGGGDEAALDGAHHSSPLVLHRLHAHPTRRGTWTLTCLIDLAHQSQLRSIKREAWMHAFLSHVARPCCSRMRAAASLSGSIGSGNSSSPGHSGLFAVRFLEERPFEWHQQLTAQ